MRFEGGEEIEIGIFGERVCQAGRTAIAVILRGHLSMSGDIFDCQDWVWGCYWHPVGSAKEYC